MGIFDPNEVITEYSLRQAVEDGVLIEIFKNRWEEFPGGKPIVATMNVFESVSEAELWDIWNKCVYWKGHIEPKLPEEERLFSTEVNYMTIWVIEDAVAYIIMYPEDY